MRMLAMSAAVVLLLNGAAAGQDLLGGKTAQEVLEAERAHVEFPEFQSPSLLPGDKAPALDVATFVKGAPISEFEEGTVYLVDFWATWCSPCIRLMPHLNELQTKHADNGLRVLGVSIWENAEGDALVDHVTAFVDKRGDGIGYTVAIDNNEAMAESWMAASGQQGIPTVMLVDQAGDIAWIGYGNDEALDGALESVLAGTWDKAAARESRLAAAKEEFAANNDAERQWFAHFGELVEENEAARATALAAALHQTGGLTNPEALNAIAWTMVENEGWSKESAGLARDLAKAALDQLDWADANVLDTLGWAYFRLGEFDKAIETEMMAVEKSLTSEQRDAFKEVVETFKKAKEGV